MSASIEHPYLETVRPPDTTDLQSLTAPQLSSPWPGRIAIAVVASGTSVALTHLLWPALRQTPFLLGFGAAILSSRLRGRHAGFLAAGVSALGYALFPPPTFHGTPIGLLAGYLVVSATFGWLVARRYEIEGALRSSESRLADAQQVAHVGSWEWRIHDNRVWWSDEIYRVFGVTRDDFDPSYSAFIERVHPDDRARIHDAHQRCFAEHEPFEVEHRIVRPDGEVRTIISKGRMTLGQAGEVKRVIGVAQDITDRKESEEIVARSQRRLKTIIDTQPACVKLVSWDGRLLEMNPAGLKMLGVDDASHVLQRSVIEVIHPDDREGFLAVHRAASAGTPGRLEFRITGVDGMERWVDSHMVPLEHALDRPDSAPPVLSVTSDITDRKQLEEQLRDAQKMEAIGRLAGGIAHDFNNLLTVIGGLTETALLEIDEDNPAATDLREVQKAADAGAALIRQLLLFSRRQVVPIVAVDLNVVIADVEPLLRRTIGPGIELDIRLADDLRLIKGDVSQLHQVIMNLAVNARDAMPFGGMLAIETSRVHLEGRSAQSAGLPPGRYSQLTVRDTGHGMTPETKSRIFEPFFTTKDAGRGTGLGLSTVYGIVRSIGASIAVASEVGRGTTFTLYFPAAAGTLARREVAVTPPSGPPNGDKTILLVDDDDRVRAFAARVLRLAGYRIIEAGSPVRALELIAHESEHVDAMLTDIVMPGMNGCELAEQVKSRRPQVPVLFMSGYAEDVIRDTSLNKRHLLEKPFTPRELLRRMQEVIGGHQDPGMPPLGTPAPIPGHLTEQPLDSLAD